MNRQPGLWGYGVATRVSFTTDTSNGGGVAVGGLEFQGAIRFPRNLKRGKPEPIFIAGTFIVSWAGRW
jgi:hypothetical protein